MRALLTVAGGDGHFVPLVPIARALEAAGHTVAVCGGHVITPTVESTGLVPIPVGSPPGGTRKRQPLLGLDQERDDRELRELFARDIARTRAAELPRVCAAWRPDLLVCEEVDFGAMIAAEALGIPHATVLVIASGSFVRKEIVTEPLHELRRDHGLPPDGNLDMPARHLVLSPFPPSFRDPAHPLPATAHSISPLRTQPSARAEPTVYFTLGTEFNTESGDLFSRALAGLRELNVNLVVTVGRDIDPAEFGPQPPTVHIERYVPQAEVLPRCTAVVSHGGSGSVMGALAYGLPSVLIPMGADQPHNARRCAALGVARVLDPVAATAREIHDAAHTVLTEPAYRRAAERIRDEIAALPGPEHAVTLLEQVI